MFLIVLPNLLLVSIQKLHSCAHNFHTLLVRRLGLRLRAMISSVSRLKQIAKVQHFLTPNSDFEHATLAFNKRLMSVAPGTRQESSHNVTHFHHKSKPVV